MSSLWRDHAARIGGHDMPSNSVADTTDTPGTRARREWNHRDRDKPENLARELNATAEHLEDMAVVHTDRGNAAAARDAASRAAAIRRQARSLT